MPPRTRINDKRDRQAQILRAASEVAKDKGFLNITRDNVAEKAAVSPALVTAHFGSMLKFRRRLMRFAVEHHIVSIVADGIAARNRIAMDAPLELKQAAAEYIARG